MPLILSFKLLFLTSAGYARSRLCHSRHIYGICVVFEVFMMRVHGFKGIFHAYSDEIKKMN